MSKLEREYSDFLNDIIAYAEKAERFVAGLTYADFIDNDEKVFAVIYVLEVIGEAASRLPHSLTGRYAKVAWTKLICMRKVLIHGYDTIDISVIWNTVHEDLPSLRQQIARILADLEGASEG
jgi:uncharacterized protein with HEPN domain